MREKHLSFAQVNDIFGFRIVVESLPECYLALGVLHQLYKPQPGRFKDYIAIPKANGYQSLHTTLVSPLGTPVEFQIRTEPMHSVAEQGIAAHWMYKAGGRKASRRRSAWAARWLQSLVDIQDETRDASEFLEHVKIDLFPDAVYVFTPKSKIMALPRGATPVDFAYAIHSDVGDHCVAARSTASRCRCAPSCAAATSSRSSPPRRAPQPGLAELRAHRAGALQDPPLPEDLEQEESRELGEKMLAQALRAEGLGLPSHDPDDAAAPMWHAPGASGAATAGADLLVDIGQAARSPPSWPSSWRA
jgi:guanosine-3',5'-bis(diphosphate) 3'-pyrophosphohydrolase